MPRERGSPLTRMAVDGVIHHISVADAFFSRGYLIITSKHIDISTWNICIFQYFHRWVAKALQVSRVVHR